MSIDAGDGRRLRSERSRERILSALRKALSDPEVAFSPALVAERAGVSQSTVFRHFGDLEGLAAAMRAQVLGEIAPLLTAGFDGERAERIRELVSRRVAVFAIVAPLSRAEAGPTPRGRRQDDRLVAAWLRAQVDAALGSELDPERGDAVDALLSLGAWQHLHELRGFDGERTTRVLEAGVLGLLGSAR